MTSMQSSSSGTASRLFWSSLFVALLGPGAAAQVPQELESRLRAIYANREFDVKRFDAQWLDDGSAYVLLEPSSGEGTDLVRYDPATGRREVLVPVSQLIPPGAAAPLILEHRSYALSPDANLLLVQTNVRTDAQGSRVQDYWLLDRKTGALRRLRADVDARFLSFSPKGDRLLFSERHNLHVEDLRSGRITQLTHDGVAGSVGNGVSDWGSIAPARWSPDGRWIAYLQVDSRRVGEFPLINHTEETYPKARYLRFPKVGTPIATQRVGVVGASGGATRWISIPEDTVGSYIDAVEWADNSDELLVQKLTRGRDARDLFLVNVRTGAVTRIHHERDDAWVFDIFSQNPGFQWIRGGRAFVWLSERGGWRRAYVISRDGAKQTVLTPDAGDVIASVKVDEKGGYLYYLASPENATQRYLYRVRLDGRGRAQRVTPSSQPGTHSYQFSPDARWAVHTYSTFDSPPVTELVQLPEHRAVRVLEDNAGLREKMKEWSPHPVEFLQLDLGNGLRFDGWLLKPRDFNPGKKYPLFIYVYAEPAAQTVLDSWGASHALFHRAMADAGYLVVSIDNRGTPAPKGSAWRRASFGSLGPLSTEEQAAGLRELGRTRSYVDLSRVGIWGWSAGGTNTLNALFRKPDQYHVGIALVPKPVPDLYNAWFQEIFMRTPEENPEGYRAAAPINYAEGLKGRLLIVHGTGETNTHLQIIEHLVNRLVELGKTFDYMVYPNRNHGLSEGPGTTLHVFNLIARYLTEHLPAGAR